MSAGVEWAIHCCVALGEADRPVPAFRLAELHEVSSTYLAKQLQSLSRAGLVTSTPGQVGGYTLSREPGKISLLEIVEAIDGAEPAFVCTEVRQRGPLGMSAESCSTMCGIRRAMLTADRAWRASLAGVTIADLALGMDGDYGPQARVGLRNWLDSPTPAR
jgi:Rrf2 family protein